MEGVNLLRCRAMSPEQRRLSSTIHDSRFTIYDSRRTDLAAPNIDTIVSLSKRRGFVFPSSEIYGGLGSAWDYGPLGVELANNVKRAWWRWMVHERDDMEGIDSSIILNRSVWRYSGHEDTFSDPLVDCRDCNARLRADKLEFDGMANAHVKAAIQAKEVKCPNCG